MLHNASTRFGRAPPQFGAARRRLALEETRIKGFRPDPLGTPMCGSRRETKAPP
jgi:hypothetical protein